MSIDIYTGELLAAISDKLTEDIDLFLVNGPLTHDQKMTMIKFMNKIWEEGFESGTKTAEEKRMADISEKHKEFMHDFTKRILGNEPETGSAPQEPTKGS